MAKKPKQTDISRALNYIRAYVPTSNISNYLDVTQDTVRNIAAGKSYSKDVTRARIFELEQDVRSQVAARQAEYIAKSKDKSLSPMQRSLAKSRALDLGKTTFTKTESVKRQKVIAEQVLPHISASQFLSHYSSGKNETQLRDELARFTDRGVEMVVTNINGNVFFSRKPLLRSTLVHPRGVVYDNNFSAGIDQIVRDLSGSFNSNLSLTDAMQEGEHYFQQCFKGRDALEVNKQFLNNFQEPTIDKKTGKEKSRGEKYKDLSKWLAERLFLGVYLY